MNLFQKAVTRALRPLIKSQRRWNGARISNLTRDWTTALATEDKELKQDLRKLVERCRDLEKNDNTVARALLLLEDNVVGSEGFKLQNKALNDRPNKDGRTSLDRNANSKVEKVWNGFCKNPTVCNLWNMAELCRVTQRMKARDGNAFWRLYRGSGYEYGLKIRLVDITYLAIEMHKDLGSGFKIVFGVETNPLGAPIAYHFYKTNPHGVARGSKLEVERVLAEDVIHFTKRLSPEQSLGAPLFSPSIIKLKMVGEYEEAHVVMARLSASKMGVIETTVPEGNTEYLEAQPTMDFSPGSIAELPPGKTFKPVDFGLGTEKFGTVVDHALRGIAGMIGISYVSLANDLTGVNYSSIRAGILEEREHYKGEQQYMIDTGLLPVFFEVQELAALSGKLGLPTSKLDRLLVPKFIPRRWSWVNPQQDIQAQIVAINNGLQTRTRVCAENGVDFEELVDELSQEQELLDERGVKLITVSGAVIESSLDETEGEEKETQKVETQKTTAKADTQKEAAAAGEVQASAMNGAQVSSLVELAVKVGMGELPSSSAIAIASAAFPLIPSETIQKIFSGITVKTPAQNAI